jgi:thiamine phosphate phosphatase / amino-HMP aminohydrolase
MLTPIFGVDPSMASPQTAVRCFNISVLLFAALTPICRAPFRTTMSHTSSQIAFILDFDGTITKNDTIDTLFKSALAIQDTKGHDIVKTWQEIIVSYERDYQVHVRAYKPVKEERRTVEQEIKFYRSLKAVEGRSFERISKSGIFAGISELEWKETAIQAVTNGDVVLREGFRMFLQRIKNSNSAWAVVSVNFSSAFIRGVLRSGLGPESKILILANQPDENGVLKGPEIKGAAGKVMSTSDAKVASVQELVGPWDGRLQGKVVYIGDSGTDIECLLRDGIIGIIMSEDGRSDLMRTMSRIGMEVLHIEKYEETSNSVYWARDYLEIVQSPLLK